MEEIMENIISKNNITDKSPGFVIYCSKEGKTVFSFQKGITDKNLTPLTNKSNFRIASITKQFTAAAILQLIEQGVLFLKTKLTDIFGDFPDYGSVITINHLLTHSSGIRNYEDSLDKITADQISDIQVLKLAKQEKNILFTPGTRYSYSNGGYCILAVILSKLSGMSFEKYIKENIFTSAGMKNSFLNSEKISKRVYGFSRSDKSGWFLNDQNKTSVTQGDGGIYSSAKDLIKWNQSLYEKGKIISDESLNIMTAPQIKNKKDNNYYGFGLYIDSFNNIKYYYHPGGSVGFEHILFYVPEKKLSIVLLSNLGDIDMTVYGKKIVEEKLS